METGENHHNSAEASVEEAVLPQTGVDRKIVCRRKRTTRPRSSAASLLKDSFAVKSIAERRDVESASSPSSCSDHSPTSASPCPSDKQNGADNSPTAGKDFSSPNLQPQQQESRMKRSLFQKPSSEPKQTQNMVPPPIAVPLHHCDSGEFFPQSPMDGNSAYFGRGSGGGGGHGSGSSVARTPTGMFSVTPTGHTPDFKRSNWGGGAGRGNMFTRRGSPAGTTVPMMPPLPSLKGSLVRTPSGKVDTSLATLMEEADASSPSDVNLKEHSRQSSHSQKSDDMEMDEFQRLASLQQDSEEMETFMIEDIIERTRTASLQGNAAIAKNIINNIITTNNDVHNNNTTTIETTAAAAGILASPRSSHHHVTLLPSQLDRQPTLVHSPVPSGSASPSDGTRSDPIPPSCNVDPRMTTTSTPTAATATITTTVTEAALNSDVLGHDIKHNSSTRHARDNSGHVDARHEDEDDNTRRNILHDDDETASGDVTRSESGSEEMEANEDGGEGVRRMASRLGGGDGVEGRGSRGGGGGERGECSPSTPLDRGGGSGDGGGGGSGGETAEEFMGRTPEPDTGCGFAVVSDCTPLSAMVPLGTPLTAATSPSPAIVQPGTDVIASPNLLQGGGESQEVKDAEGVKEEEPSGGVSAMETEEAVAVLEETSTMTGTEEVGMETSEDIGPTRSEASDGGAMDGQDPISSLRETSEDMGPTLSEASDGGAVDGQDPISSLRESVEGNEKLMVTCEEQVKAAEVVEPTSSDMKTDKSPVVGGASPGGGSAGGGGGAAGGGTRHSARAAARAAVAATTSAAAGGAGGRGVGQTAMDITSVSPVKTPLRAEMRCRLLPPPPPTSSSSLDHDPIMTTTTTTTMDLDPQHPQPPPPPPSTSSATSSSRRASLGGGGVRGHGDRQHHRVGLCFDKRMTTPHMSPSPLHPEQPGRLQAIFNRLALEDLAPRCFQIPSRLASDWELQLCHSVAHIAEVDFGFQRNPGPQAISQGDIYFSEGTATAARLAAGCVVEACKAVLGGRLDSACALIRPPGHHATNTEAMGFCFFNNVAVAAATCLRQGHARRVVILDWDVHHGNGTQDLMENDPNVLFISIHRYGDDFYPGTGDVVEVGEGPGKGFTVNIPWTVKGMGNNDYLAALDQIVIPIVKEFNPDLFIVSAGFDAAVGDPLGGMKVTANGYAAMTSRLLRAVGMGRLVVALEGGYNENMTATCMDAVVRVLLGEEPKKNSAPCRLKGGTEEILRNVAKVHSKYWACMRCPQHLAEMSKFFSSTCLTPNAQVRKEAEKIMGELGGTTSVTSDGSAPRASRRPRSSRTATSSSSSAVAGVVGNTRGHSRSQRQQPSGGGGAGGGGGEASKVVVGVQAEVMEEADQRPTTTAEARDQQQQPRGGEASTVASPSVSGCGPETSDNNSTSHDSGCHIGQQTNEISSPLDPELSKHVIVESLTRPIADGHVITFSDRLEAQLAAVGEELEEHQDRTSGEVKQEESHSVRVECYVSGQPSGDAVESETSCSSPGLFHVKEAYVEEVEMGLNQSECTQETGVVVELAFNKNDCHFEEKSAPLNDIMATESARLLSPSR